MSINPFNAAERPITAGHGEYIVYHQKNTGEKVAPSRFTYDAVYPELNHLNHPSTDNRYDVIRNRIKSIDPSLEITFVPRTYYEMQFLKKAIKEDLAKNDFCENEHRRPDPYAPKNTKDCWHIAYFLDRDGEEEDDNAEAVKVLAFNLNANLVKKLQKLSLGQTAFKFQEIEKITEKQIHFFKNFHDTFNLEEKQKYGGFGSRVRVQGEGSVIVKFSDDKDAYALGVRNDSDAQMIRNAITLECHPIAEKAFLLYRGTEFSTDLPYSPNNPMEPYSFSFGSGLFAGAMNCGGATGYVYARVSSDAYVMVVSASDPALNLFDIPKKHAISHLTTARDVIFHARTKVWKTNGVIWGFGNCCNRGSVTGPYVCNLDRETLTDQVLGFKQRNIVFLKSSDQQVSALPTAFEPTIQIRSIVPYGHSLFIRGNEAGLNWDKGQPLVQVGDGEWIYRISKNFKHLEYKILLDDSVFEEGANHKLEPGSNALETSSFNLPSVLPSNGKTSRLSVRCNPGMGHALTIRGTGPGLGWNYDVPLKNLGEDLWMWETNQHFNNFEYKILIDGVKWETSPVNHRAHYGNKVEILPHLGLKDDRKKMSLKETFSPLPIIAPSNLNGVQNSITKELQAFELILKGNSNDKSNSLFGLSQDLVGALKWGFWLFEGMPDGHSDYGAAFFRQDPTHSTVFKTIEEIKKNGLAVTSPILKKEIDGFNSLLNSAASNEDLKREFAQLSGQTQELIKIVMWVKANKPTDKGFDFSGDVIKNNPRDSLLSAAVKLLNEQISY